MKRTTGYLTLLPLPGGRSAGTVADAVIEHMSVLPPWFARTLTWDRGLEMAQHKRITAETGICLRIAASGANVINCRDESTAPTA